MADVKITELPELTEVAADDYLEIVDTSTNTNKKISRETLTNFAWQSWTPTLTGWSGTPQLSARYVVHGNTVHFAISVVGTSNSTLARITLPTGLTAANIHANHEWNGACQIATSTNQAAAGRWRIGNNGTDISVDNDWADGNWATTGAKAVKLSGFYEVA